MGGDIILHIKQRIANMGFNPDDVVIRQMRVELKAGATFEERTNGDYWYLYELANYDGKWKIESDTSITFDDDFVMDGKVNMAPVECYGDVYIATEPDLLDAQTNEPTTDNSNKFVFFVAQTGRLIENEKV